MRPLLPGPEDVLRDEVLRLRIPPHRLATLASHAAIEALALQNLATEEITALERIIHETGGALLSDETRDHAVVIAPLAVAGELRQRLSAGGATALGDAIGDALVNRGAAPPVVARGHTLRFGARTLVMGIVNVTPDSFSGDGLGDDTQAAVAAATAMVAAGADVIDIGGESTRPNSSPVDVDEELARVLPVIERLATAVGVPLSIDTRKAEVAAAALDAGAALVNDVWGLQGDPDMASVVAAHHDSGVIVMHNHRGVEYGNLMADITARLRLSIAIAAEAGIADERIIVDPGFGFGKTPAQNLEVMRRLRELRGIGRPLLVGPSRKSTIGVLTGGAPPGERLEGSLALAALAVANGADIVRVHDVAATRRAVTVADAVVRGTPESVRALPAPGPTG